MSNILNNKGSRPTQQHKSLHQMAAQFRLDELQLFNQVAQVGSFSAAAKELGITQSTASKRIRKLEEGLDLRLLDRTTRNVVLTDLGREFLTHSRRMLADFDEAINFVQQSRTSPVGEIKVGMPQWLLLGSSDFFAQFLAKYPGIQFSFFNLKSAKQMAENADLDVMLHFQAASDRKMVSEPLFEFSVDYFVGKGYLRNSPPIEHPGQLRQHNCLLIRNYLLPDREWLWTDEQGTHHSIMVNPLAKFDHVEQALEWAMRDLGVIWCPQVMVAECDSDLKLTRLFDGKYGSKFTMNAIYPARQVISPKVKLFLEEIKRYVAETADCYYVPAETRVF